MSIYVTRTFWTQAAERALKTTAQAAIGAIGATALVQELDWTIVGGTTVIATILSVLSSVASAPVGDDSTPSLV